MTNILEDEVYGEFKIQMEYHRKLGGFRAIKFSFKNEGGKTSLYVQKLAQSGNLAAPIDLIKEQLKLDGLKVIKEIIDNGKFEENKNYGQKFSDLNRKNGNYFLNLS